MRPERDETVDTVHVAAGWWSCPKCSFRRHFATAQGALMGASKHLAAEHRIRLTLPTRHHGDLYGGDHR